MKYATIVTLALLALCTLTANRAGRASASNVGNTGAPGDIVTPNGQPQTCINCHNAGNVLVNPVITLLDAAGDSVQQYAPGQDYTVRLTVNISGGDVVGYGFQMIGLRDSDNTDLKGFSAGGSYKLVTVSTTGRIYAEHNNMQVNNVFDVAWKAPVAGSGSVTFYAAANGVNNNLNTSGDDSGVTQRTFAEQTVSTSDLTEASGWGLAPSLLSPARAVVALQSPESGAAWIRVFDAAGRLCRAEKITLSVGANELDAAYWPGGSGFVQVEMVGKKPQILRFVKL